MFLAKFFMTGNRQVISGMSSLACLSNLRGSRLARVPFGEPLLL